ncbi:hypothetical protein OIO90_001841 [Microbotryomycetes sp. JL221]|nr:hypothetical protein OIO90_001841 [Microbotryomycetes sp. JL221]
MSVDPTRAMRLIEDDAFEPRGVDMMTGSTTMSRLSLDYNEPLQPPAPGSSDRRDNVLFDHDSEDPWHLDDHSGQINPSRRDDQDERLHHGQKRPGRRRLDDNDDRQGAVYAPMQDNKARRSRYGGNNDEDDEDDDDGLAWEPSLSTSDINRHRDSIASSSARPIATFGRSSQSNTFQALPQRDMDTPSLSSRSPNLNSLGSLDKRTKQALWWRTAMINCLFIAAWYTFSTCISVYNKWMFSSDHYDFPYPLFVTSCHMLVQWSLAGLTLTIFKNLRPTTRPHAGDYAKNVAPCGVATGLDIGLSNLSLRSITLSFYTMCKSSSLAFVLLFAFLFRLEVPTWRLVGIIFVITSGVILMVSTETQFDFAGMVEVLTASAMGGLRWSLTQILLDKEALGMNNPIATLFWLAPVMGLTLATCSMIWDGWWTVFGDERFFGGLWTSLRTCVAILFPGVLAFCMNVTEFGQVHVRTSVVTLSVAGIFKEVGTIFLSTFIFHDQLTPINISGLVITILGIAMYNYLKYVQFLKDPDAASKGHGASIRRHSNFNTQGSERHRTSNEESYDEDAPMLSNRDVVRGSLEVTKQGHLQRQGTTDQLSLKTLGNGTTTGGALDEDDGLDGPLHRLGSDDEDSISSFESTYNSPDAQRPLGTRTMRQGSVSLPSEPRHPFTQGPSHGSVEANGSSLHLEAETLGSKLHEHDHDRIKGLQAKIHQDGDVQQLEREQQELNDLLDLGMHEEQTGRERTRGHEREISLMSDGDVGDLLGQVDDALADGERRVATSSLGKSKSD